MDNESLVILHVALDTPLRRVFDYRSPTPPSAGEFPAPPCQSPRPGIRIRVPFGRRELVGVLVGTAPDSPLDPAKLKTAIKFLDEAPVFDPVTFELLRWAADYYHHPLGEVIAAALPVSLREGQPAGDIVERWVLTAAGRQELASPTDRRSPRQRALLAWLGARTVAPVPGEAPVPGATTDEIIAVFKPAHLHAVGRRGWAAATRAAAAPAAV